MQSAVLRALEFDRIVEMVRAFALTPMGDEQLAHLAPSGEAQKVAQWLAATTETTKYLAANALFPLRASSELPQVLAALAVEGRALEPLRLVALAAFLDSVDEAKAAIRRAAGSFAHLEAAAGPAASFKMETTEVRSKIDQSGEVVDDASTELKHVRERLRNSARACRGTLESYLRGKGHREMPCRISSSRSGMDATCSSSRPSTARRFPASCTARRRAAPACFSSR